MKENRIKVFHDTEDLYAPNTPVVVREKTLYKDKKTGNSLAQLKLQNISNETIVAVTVRITPLDTLLDPLGEVFVFEYQKIAIMGGEEFGAKDLFPFANPATRFFRAEICSATFESGAVWNGANGDSGKAERVLITDVYQKAVIFSKNKTKTQDDEDFEKAEAVFKALDKAKSRKKTRRVSAVLAVLCLIIALAGYFVMTSFEKESVSAPDTPSFTMVAPNDWVPVTPDTKPDSDNGHDSNNQRPTVTTATPASDRYPTQLKDIGEWLEDTTVQFVYVEGNIGTYTADSIWIDAEHAATIDAVDQQIIDRNNRIYDDLGVTIETVTDPTLGVSGLYTYANTYFYVQDPGIDVYCGFQYYDLKSARSGNFLNLNTIVNEKSETVIDTTQSYWATNYINSITYNDQMYWVTGDLSLRCLGDLYCTYVNLDLYDEYIKSSYGNRSIYDIVNDKEWTMQTMLKMAESVYSDKDGNGTTSEGDRLGIVFESNSYLDALTFGCRISFTERSTENGKETFQIALGNNQRANELANYINTMFESIYAYSDGSNFDYAMPLFAEGDVLFAFDTVFGFEEYLPKMTNLAIIPMPMLDDSQGDYTSGARNSMTIFGISKYSNCPVASAATLELMAYYGRLLVTPVYINSHDLAQNEEAVAMFKLLRQNLDTDFGAAWGERLDNIAAIFRSQENVSKFQSYIKAKERFWESQLAQLLEDLDKVAAAQ